MESYFIIPSLDGLKFFCKETLYVLYSVCDGICCLSLQDGEVIIRNHQTGDKAVVIFSPYSKVGSKYRHIAGENLCCSHLTVLSVFYHV